jgi:hypothetical protein
MGDSLFHKSYNCPLPYIVAFVEYHPDKNGIPRGWQVNPCPEESKYDPASRHTETAVSCQEKGKEKSLWQVQHWYNNTHGLE